MFDGRHVVLGVSGGIAAYKAIEVCRRLVDGGARVTPILTESALRFVGPVTFEALATEPLVTSVFGNADPIPHTTLGQTADLIIVAPATARAIGSYAAGISDDALVATLIATRAPVLVCPAMHTEMWEHPSVQENLATLRRRGVHVLDPESGRLAGGDVGAGRLADPQRIVAEAARILTPPDMAGLKVLVTAGGTREPIDPVRYIGNRSSGKQGYAVAAEAAARGAEVRLISTVDRPVPPGVQVTLVETAAQMHEAVMQNNDADVVVMSAAVADYRPISVAGSKIKKTADQLDVALEKTVDILAALGAAKRPGQTLVGFAAETDDVVDNARGKLERKGADFIVANDVSAPDVGFAHDTNEVTIVSANGSVGVPLRSKRDIAKAILDQVVAARSSDPTS
ncbi:MAG: bifunctional phosphopantothenoylcysteine decarboxylase/phosphopantothenate--cysteine ligase CoaBC [Acidimicrobiales bacterium]|nr:bifunctional phosphopantothenoylcysteine decarboxylase/phosphopantothenate--cysteine ligase CoaBC [Acidimicrobiales bacterium]